MITIFHSLADFRFSCWTRPEIQDEAGKFGGAAGYHSACAYGGAPKRDQLREIQSGASILVATPGRLNDFLDSNQLDLSKVKKPCQ